LKITDFVMERWLSGRKRSPAKGVYPERGIEGSNPSLSAKIPGCLQQPGILFFDHIVEFK
jgi:hypothetical protein